MGSPGLGGRASCTSPAVPYTCTGPTFSKSHFLKIPLSQNPTFSKSHFLKIPLSQNPTLSKWALQVWEVEQAAPLLPSPTLALVPLSQNPTFSKSHFLKIPLFQNPTFSKSHF